MKSRVTEKQIISLFSIYYAVKHKLFMCHLLSLQDLRVSWVDYLHNLTRILFVNIQYIIIYK